MLTIPRRSRAGLSGGLVALAVAAAPLLAAAPAGAAPATGHASAPLTETQAVATATRSLATHREAIHGGQGEQYQLIRSMRDKDGTAHLRYRRTYHGLPVRGGDFAVHQSPTGAFLGADTGRAAALTLGTTARIPAAKAAATARTAFEGSLASTGTPSLVVDATGTAPKLAWETLLTGKAPDRQTPVRLHVFTDAGSGAVLHSYDEIETILGTGNSLYSGTVKIDTTLTGSVYSMIDPSHGNGSTCDMGNGSSTCTTFTDADNVWGNGTNSDRASAAVDAHYGAAATFDFYRTTFGRNGIFNDGKGVKSRVHYGSAYVNAFWDGTQMTYGDGTGNAKPLVALDVAGHEMSHGVTQATAGLVYSGDAGGLNEATSDIMGTNVEFFADNAADPGDYDIGEKIDIHGNGKPLRYMYHPSLDGVSDDCWSTATPGRDPHYSSGVGNHLFFLLAEGSGVTPYGTSPVCGTSGPVTGIGRKAAAAIWYRALTVYMVPTETYAQARKATLAAAADLYGSCSTQYKAVQAAWTAVNVFAGDTGCVPIVAPMGSITVDGGRPYVFVKGADGDLWVRWWSGSAWAWSTLGHPAGVSIESSVGAVAVDGSRPYVFVKGSDGNLWVQWWSGTAWSWSNQGRPTGVDLKASHGVIALDNAARPYVFEQGSDGNLWTRWWSGTAWAWSSLGTPGAV
ncbi:MAG: hypothetical protein QOI35_3327 [Cryptosporangiaceae bacterium]|nr:hypothetical protein [Cryptosporangiaceae bacterium]